MADYQPTNAPAKARRPKRTIVLAANANVAFLLDDLVSVDQAAALYDTTRAAIEKKIERGHWLEGRQYHRDPLGLIWVSRKGVQAWVVSGGARR